jgi:CRISPR-associated protein Cas1
MSHRVIEIQENGRHLSLHRGFMVISAEKKELARLPLDEIAVVIANAFQLSYSHNLLVELSARGIAFIVCGTNRLPGAILWPVAGHHDQTGIMQAQADMTSPLRKQLWKRMVQAKIRAQHEGLELNGCTEAGLLAMASRVRSGDPDNLEAQAARRYWRQLFGDDFRRDKDGDSLNGLLNYGYAIIRSGIARAVMAAGLHPSLGVFHRNRLNPMCLVDDLMEPYRPLVDVEVRTMQQESITEVTAESKARLAKLLVKNCTLEQVSSPVTVAMQRSAHSLAEALCEKNHRLLLFPEKLLSSPRQAQLQVD